MSDSGSDDSQPLRHLLQQHVADAMAERVVDDLEAVDVEEQDREVGALAAVHSCAMPAAQIVERRAEDAPVRQAGQRVLGRQPRDMGFGLAALGDVGEGLHEAAVGQLAAADLDDAAVRHLRSETANWSGAASAPATASADRSMSGLASAFGVRLIFQQADRSAADS